MKIFDERIRKEEVKDLSVELVDVLTQALGEDYGILIGTEDQKKLTTDISKVLAKFFNVRI